MPKKDFTKTSKLLLYLLAIGEVVTYGLGTPRSIQKAWQGQNNSIRTILYQLHKRGLIQIKKKPSKKLISLTTIGKIEALFLKARLTHQQKKWDGKWRMIIFDIPEVAKKHRNQLRGLLLRHGFVKLQISVYISPYPLHQDAVAYLQESKLIKHIRIAKIEKMDNDTDLKKHFNLF